MATKTFLLVLATFIFMEITMTATAAANLKGLKHFTPNSNEDPKDPRGNSRPSTPVPVTNLPNPTPGSVPNSVAKGLTSKLPNSAPGHIVPKGGSRPSTLVPVSNLPNPTPGSVPNSVAKGLTPNDRRINDPPSFPDVAKGLNPNDRRSNDPPSFPDRRSNDPPSFPDVAKGLNPNDQRSNDPPSFPDVAKALFNRKSSPSTVPSTEL